MEKQKIIRQLLENVGTCTGSVTYGEMAKDLQNFVKDDEVLQGAVEACENNIGYLVKNGDMIRSFMAVTDQKVYLITRGRRILNMVSLLDKTIVIPRNQILHIEEKAVPIQKLLCPYAAELSIVTAGQTYGVYVKRGFEERLPKSFLNQVGVVADLSRKAEEGQWFCQTCGGALERGMKFCPKCGEAVGSGEKKRNICPGCGQEFEEDAKFCAVCGTKRPRPEKEEEDVL